MNIKNFCDEYNIDTNSDILNKTVSLGFHIISFLFTIKINYHIYYSRISFPGVIAILLYISSIFDIFRYPLSVLSIFFLIIRNYFKEFSNDVQLQ